MALRGKGGGGGGSDSPLPGQALPAALSVGNEVRTRSFEVESREAQGSRESGGSGPRNQRRRHSSEAVTPGDSLSDRDDMRVHTPNTGSVSSANGRRRQYKGSPGSSRRMSWTNAAHYNSFSHKNQSSEGREDADAESRPLEVGSKPETQMYPELFPEQSKGLPDGHQDVVPHKVVEADLRVSSADSVGEFETPEDMEVGLVNGVSQGRSSGTTGDGSSGTANGQEAKAEAHAGDDGVEHQEEENSQTRTQREEELIHSTLQKFEKNPHRRQLIIPPPTDPGEEGSYFSRLDSTGSSAVFVNRSGSSAHFNRRSSTDSPDFVSKDPLKPGHRSRTFYKQKWNEAIWYATQQAQLEKRKRLEPASPPSKLRQMGSVANFKDMAFNLMPWQKGSQHSLTNLHAETDLHGSQHHRHSSLRSSGSVMPAQASSSTTKLPLNGFSASRGMTFNLSLSDVFPKAPGSPGARRRSRVASCSGSDGQPDASAMRAVQAEVHVPTSNDKFNDRLVRTLESRSLFTVLFFSVMVNVGLEDMLILIDTSWARRKPILVIQLVTFFILSVEHMARVCVSATYTHSVQFHVHVLITLLMTYELVWVFAEYDICRDLLHMDSKLSNLSARTVGWALRIGFMLNLILRWYGKNFFLVTELSSHSSTFAKLKVKQSGDSLDVGSLLAVRLSHWIHRDIAMLAALMLLISHGLSTATQPNRTHGLVSVLDTMLSLYEQYGNSSVTPNPYAVAQETWVSGMEVTNGMPVNFILINDQLLYGARESEKKHPLVEINVLHTKEHDGVTDQILLQFRDTNGLYYDALLHVAGLLSCTFILIIGSENLMYHINERVIGPTEALLDLVDQMTTEPLKPLVIAHGTAKNEESEVVQAGLIRIGSLLQVAFGEAGSAIMRSQMQNGQIDYSHLPGHITKAIFGFCDIRNFTDLTEVLQADVTKVVNSVAVYVHESVVDNHGAPNKNIGDAFLMVWKPKDGLLLKEEADAALRSYIRIILELSTSQTLRVWAEKPGIQRRLPGFRIKLGFGLHFGWAVECAIGTKRKLEASYLSPHVNMASRLESATKMYGVEILISEDTYKLMSDGVRNQCRKVDRVTVKGSNNPMSLYTYDVPTYQKFGGQLDEEADISSPTLSTDEFYTLCKPQLPERFMKKFKRAIHLYIGHDGGLDANWRESISLLESCLEMVPNDGPSTTILTYMQTFATDTKTGVPQSWCGFRGLSEK